MGQFNILTKLNEPVLGNPIMSYQRKAGIQIVDSPHRFRPSPRNVGSAIIIS
jgi:hypothetical protein